jgi:ABC-type spermidine/putrescine transport system permease subunit II
VLSSFVSTADATPFPVYVFASIRSALRPSIAAMSTLMLLLTLVALALVAIVLVTARRRTGEGMSLASTLAGG